MKKLYIILLLLAISVTVQAQVFVTDWQTAVGGFLQEYSPSDLVKTNDSGFVVVGTSNSNIGGLKSQQRCNDMTPYADYWVVKLDAMGNKDWDYKFGGDLGDGAFSVIQTLDNGFLVSGTSNSPISCDKTSNNHQDDFWILKLNSNGILQWQKRYGGAGSEGVEYALQATDGSFYIAGRCGSNTSYQITDTAHGGYDILVFKLDSLGNKKWDHLYGGSGDDVINNMTLLSDGNLLMIGSTNSYGPDGDVTEPPLSTFIYNEDGWVLKIDSAGNKMWDKRYGGTAIDIGTAACEYADSTLLIGVGITATSTNSNITDSVSHGLSDMWMLKLDYYGNKIWDKRIGGDKDDGFYDIVKDGSDFILSGISKSDSSFDKSENCRGGFDYWIVKIDSAGNKIWDKTYGSSSDDESNRLVINADNNYTVCGYTRGSISGDKTVPTWDTASIIGSGWRGDLWCLRFHVDTTTSLHDLQQQIQFALYPNPARNVVNLQWQSTSTVTAITVYDLQGRTILQQTVTSKTEKTVLNISSLSRGVYIVTVSDGLKSGRRKLAVE